MASDRGRPEEAPLHAVAAAFGSADALLACVRALATRGFGRLDAYSPIPIPGMAEALGLRHAPLSRLALGGVLAGFAASMGLCVYATVYDYPFDIGGRPAMSWPAFVVPSVSFAMLTGALLVYLGMLFLNRLPRLNHPAFNIPDFERVTQDRYMLSVEPGEDPLDAEAIEQALAALPDRPLAVMRVAR